MCSFSTEGCGDGLILNHFCKTEIHDVLPEQDKTQSLYNWKNQSYVY